MADVHAPEASKLLWQHPSPQSTTMHAFLQHINEKHAASLSSYDELHAWSIDNLSALWGAIWDYVGIRASQPFSHVLDPVAEKNRTMFPRPAWFAGAKLNFAENLLFPAPAQGPNGGKVPGDNDVAAIEAGEASRQEITWSELRERVRVVQAGMKARGVQAGDRVAGFVGNHAGALVAMLAATSLGAIWTAVSPDTGVTAVLDRLTQIEPVLLFADAETFYNGRKHDVLGKVKEIVSKLPTLKACVVVSGGDKVQQGDGVLVSLVDFTKDAPKGELTFAQLDPDHPVYILYSSGTTGAPKCIVHGAIGTLIQHKKEHILQCDIRAGQRVFYYSTTTWMMWHWLVSGLAAGATLVLYDGSPFMYTDGSGGSAKDNLAMPRLIDELQIAHFGTSAKYLSMLEQNNVLPLTNNLSLSTLKAIYSTGSPLAPSTFEYVYKAFGQIMLGSITGGTDIVSLFGAPSPLVPVYAGEIQCLGLGMSIEAWDPSGTNVSSTGEPGELICTRPFPCQPVSFFGSTGAEKYKNSYFATFPGVWAHGDFIRFSPETKGLWMLGRSDGILKPSGVRFGSAEIYNLLLAQFPDKVSDALCIGRRRAQDDDETVVLFLLMQEGKDFDQDLVAAIKKVVRTELSARHVPGIIDQCPEIPVTANGKKVEGAVKQILSGTNVKTSASVVNAECLDWYRDWAAKH